MQTTFSLQAMSSQLSDINTLSVSEHYNQHLGQIYSWMTGDFSAAVEGMTGYFNSLDLKPTETGLAVDLGAGHGIQSVALAKLGFSVKAVDFCQPLLKELEANAKNLTIETINDDILSFSNYVKSPVDVVVCMGDTLTHLESPKHVTELVNQVAESLVKNGLLCTSFRDYTNNELEGDARFIPVRADNERIHTCFLEYEESSVRVSDIVHTRVSDGWNMTLSSYRKLRLSPSTLEAIAKEYGLGLCHQSTRRGMHYITFKRS